EAAECPAPYRFGRTLREEVAACLLGGHGIPAEVGVAAFYHLRDCGLLDEPIPTAPYISRVLRRPLIVNGRSVQYRFSDQKADYLHDALSLMEHERAPTSSPTELRAFLMRIRGVGPKTASWITRNWLTSDDVAIIDVHI